MAEFPSVAWFEAVSRVFNSDESYRGAGGGQCHCQAGIKVGKRVFGLVFEGFECSGASEMDASELETVDFYLEMPLKDWKAMIQDIAENGAASLHYTLNTLDLGRETGISRSVHGDQYREDLFFRYNQTFQFFFDASARIETTFA
ncbi:MAG: hypothetical protein O7G86_09470 [Gammaproteobacteria bacterium]|nr:hypothetical protein [Gammaproteobacteria bacterium]